MRYFDCDEPRKKSRWVWFFILGAVWLVWIIGQGNAAYDKAAAELAANQSSGHVYSAAVNWWHKDDPDKARNGWILGGLCGLVLVFAVAHFIAGIQTNMMQAAAVRREERQARRDQRDFAKKLESIDHESNQQAALSKAAHSKRELIMRLGTIDQYIRVLAVEGDVSQRTVALQAAHSEMTTLAAKLSSGQISREAVDDDDVREQAAETSHDLDRLGLANDRLNRDIVRMFKLKSK